MKIKNLILTAALILTLGSAKSQTTSEWIPVLVNVDGTNTYKAVELYYSLSTCGGNDVVLLKLINGNAKAVKAQWISAIVGAGDKEYYGNTKLVSVNLKANSEVVGACNTKPNELVVKLSDFGVSVKDFKTIVGSSFYVE